MVACCYGIMIVNTPVYKQIAEEGPKKAGFSSPLLVRSYCLSSSMLILWDNDSERGSRQPDSVVEMSYKPNMTVSLIASNLLPH